MSYKHLKLLFSYCFLLLSTCYVNGQDNHPISNQQSGGLDIFLLIGQSNMQGAAPILDLDTITLENVYLFNDKSRWEPARNLKNNGMNRYSTVKRRPTVLFGPAYTFGRKIAIYTGREIGIVSNARGATRIEWWQKGYSGENDFDLYEQAILRAKAALAAAPEGSRIAGILWHQGEADYTVERSQKYSSRLQSLVHDLRKDLGNPELPFIAGEVGKWNNRGIRVNPVIRDIKSFIQNSDWVSSDGLTSINEARNDAHFDNLSQRSFGGRYADKVARLVYNIKPGGVTIYNSQNYQGRDLLLPPGLYSAADIEGCGILPNEISSIKLDDGYELVIYSQGKDKTITSNLSLIKDLDIFESVRIIKK